MKNIDNYLKDKVKIGYVYFIYSNILNKVYVGETTSMDRINIYKSLIEEKDNKNKIRLYNFYTKSNVINYELAGDIVNYKSEFKIEYIETKYHKHLEKSYISWLYKMGYDLYNSKLYKKHIFDNKEIDMNLIKEIGLEPNVIKQMWLKLNKEGYIGNVYLGEGLYGDKEGNIVDEPY